MCNDREHPSRLSNHTFLERQLWICQSSFPLRVDVITIRYSKGIMGRFLSTFLNWIYQHNDKVGIMKQNKIIQQVKQIFARVGITWQTKSNNFYRLLKIPVCKANSAKTYKSRVALQFRMDLITVTQDLKMFHLTHFHKK